MATTPPTPWFLRGQGYEFCNCQFGCGCNFGGYPTPPTAVVGPSWA